MTTAFRDAVEAMHRRGIGGAGVTIGHIDTMIDEVHPALTDRLDVIRVVSHDGFSLRAPETSDTAEAHGTHLAAVMVGDARLRANRGVAPGARLAVGVAIESGSVVARMATALDWLAGLGVGVVCIPCGLPSSDLTLAAFIDPLRRRDVVVVAPIGNRGAGAGMAPGSYDNVVSVGASDADGRVATFSGSCNDASGRVARPDVLAPGVDVRGARPGGGSRSANGTSASAAQIAGLAALLRSAVPEASAIAVQRAIIGAAAPLPDGQRHRARGGLVDPCRALELAVNEPQTPATDGAVRARSIDPRLEWRLSSSRADTLIDVLMVCDSARDVDRVSDIADPLVTHRYRHTPGVLLRARADRLRQMLGTGQWRHASASDVDRSIGFLGY